MATTLYGALIEQRWLAGIDPAAEALRVESRVERSVKRNRLRVDLAKRTLPPDCHVVVDFRRLRRIHS